MKKSAMFMGIVAMLACFEKSSASIKLHTESAKTVDMGTSIDINLEKSSKNLFDIESLLQAMTCAKQMVDNQVNISLARTRGGKVIPLCVSTFLLESFLNFPLSSLEAPFGISFMISDKMMRAKIGENITKEDISDWRAMSFDDMKSSLNPETMLMNPDSSVSVEIAPAISSKSSFPCPANFDNFPSMMDFLVRSKYLGEEMTFAIEMAYDRSEKHLKKIAKKQKLSDWELNAEFCRQFLMSCSEPNCDILNPWLDHGLKHATRNHPDPRKELCLENVITQDSYFFIENSRSIKNSMDLREKNSTTISLLDVFKIIESIMKEYSIVMTCERGIFTLQPAEIKKTTDNNVVVRLLENVNLQNSLLPGEYNGLIKLEGIKGFKLSQFTGASIIEKSNWPEEIPHTFFFHITMGAQGTFGGSIYERYRNKLTPFSSDYTSELKRRIDTWLAERRLTNANIQLIERLVEQKHALSMLGISQEALNDLQIQETPDFSFVQNLETMRKYPQLLNFTQNLVRETIDNMRCMSVLETLPLKEFHDSLIGKVQAYTGCYSELFEKKLEFLNIAISRPQTVTINPQGCDSDISRRATSMVMLTHPELIEKIIGSCYYKGKKKVRLLDKGNGFLKKIIEKLRK